MIAVASQAMRNCASRAFIAVLLAVSGCASFAQLPESALDSAALAGLWTGTARMYEVKLDKAVGRIPVSLNIANDRTLTGMVGQASILPAMPPKSAKRVAYYARLSGAVYAGAPARMDYVVFLITGTRHDRLSGDIHLKSRFGFDPGMHPGSLELVRSP